MVRETNSKTEILFMKKATTALLTLCVSTFILTAAETNAPVSDFARLKQSTDRFILAVIKGGSAEAFGALLKGQWYRPAEAAAAALDLDSAYLEVHQGLEQEIGKQLPGACEFLGRRRVGNSLVTYVYVEKHEEALWPWAFTFYKAQNEWKLRAVAFGTGAADDLLAMAVTETAK
jgi:hypothetical protein